MPSDTSTDDIPMDTNQWEQPITPTIFNHKKFVESFDVNSFIQNESIPPCQLKKFTVYRSWTQSDLQIVRNNKLRKLRTTVFPLISAGGTY